VLWIKYVQSHFLKFFGKITQKNANYFVFFKKMLYFCRMEYIMNLKQ
jgi:hypothetical protein